MIGIHIESDFRSCDEFNHEATKGTIGIQDGNLPQ